LYPTREGPPTKRAGGGNRGIFCRALRGTGARSRLKGFCSARGPGQGPGGGHGPPPQKKPGARLSRLGGSAVWLECGDWKVAGTPQGMKKKLHRPSGPIHAVDAEIDFIGFT